MRSNTAPIMYLMQGDRKRSFTEAPVVGSRVSGSTQGQITTRAVMLSREPPCSAASTRISASFWASVCVDINVVTYFFFICCFVSFPDDCEQVFTSVEFHNLEPSTVLPSLTHICRNVVNHAHLFFVIASKLSNSFNHFQYHRMKTIEPTSIPAFLKH